MRTGGLATRTVARIAILGMFGCACNGAFSDTTDDAGDLDLERACGPERGLMSVEDVLADPDDPCRPWLALVIGRVVRVGSASGSIWTRRTEYGTGVLTTAAHVASPCLSNPGDCTERLHDPTLATGVPDLRLVSTGGELASQWSPRFALYNPPTPRDQVGSPDIVPRYDFSLYAVDAQVFETWGTGLGIQPDPIVNAPLALHDPAGLTLAEPTWTTAESGVRVLVVGLDGTWPYNELKVSAARVLTDDEASRAIDRLAAAGDEEGAIPYDPQAELLLEGHAVVGMSGGGVFDEQGLQVGILVRGSFAELDVQYLRATRMSYVVSSVEGAFTSLSSEEKDAVGPYLEER